MTASRDPERLIRAFLDEGPVELPERAYHAVRSTIDQTRHRDVVGPWRDTRMFNRARYALAGLATLAVLVVGVGLFAQRGSLLAPGTSPAAASTPLANPSATPSPVPATPTMHPSTDAPATPPASPKVSPAVTSMQAVWQDDEGACTMNDVAVVDDGLVAVGWCGSRPPLEPLYGVAWYSETGFEWRRVFQIEWQVLAAVSPDGDGEGAVLLGGFADLPIPQNPELPRVFRGDQSAGFEEEQLPNPQGAASELIGIARIDQNLFVLGATYVDSERRPAAWISSSPQDDWRLIDVPTDLALTEPDVRGNAQLVTADETGFVIAGNTPLVPAVKRYDLSSGWGAPDEIPHVRSCWDCNGPGSGQVTALIDSAAVIVDDVFWMKFGDAWSVQATIGERPGEFYGYAGLRVEDGFIVAGVMEGAESPAVVATSRDGWAWQFARLRPDAAPPGSDAEPAVYGMVEFGGRVVAVGDAVYVGPANVSDYSP
jgi:hypothetical protein